MFPNHNKTRKQLPHAQNHGAITQQLLLFIFMSLIPSGSDALNKWTSFFHVRRHTNSSPSRTHSNV
jgi:hypothetical protein